MHMYQKDENKLQQIDRSIDLDQSNAIKKKNTEIKYLSMLSIIIIVTVIGNVNEAGNGRVMALTIEGVYWPP